MGNLFTKIPAQISRKFTISPYYQTFTDESIQPLLKDLEENTQNITEIQIGKHKFTEDSLCLLTNIIQECQNLSIVDFSQVVPDIENPEILETLNSTLLCLHNLYEVNLSHNYLTEDTIDILSFLFHSDNLKSLKINDNLLGVEGAIKLAEAFRNSELILYVFCAERNFFEDQGILELSEAFSNMKSLRQLSLSGNNLGKEGIIMICRSMMNNPDLQILDLCDSYINEETAFVSIRHLLENNFFITRLGLNDCMLGNNGAKVVVGALRKTNLCLRELWLAYNEIDDDEVGELIAALLTERKMIDMIEKIMQAAEYFIKDSYFVGIDDHEETEED